VKLSYVIVTHNRREPLLRTLDILHRTTPAEVGAWECLVVDNGSSDGSAEAVAATHPDVRLLRRRRNEGVAARNHGIFAAQGEYVVLLDDDSYPTGDAVPRSIEYLDARADVAAVVGRCDLPNGAHEACALPGVMLSGAVCVRRRVFEEVGGFRREFFRKAGEYDVSFRMWEAGYAVERFEDVTYRHDKVAAGRSAALAHRMDLRNNLILCERYLPPPLRQHYRADWTQRYTAIAAHDGHAGAARRARLEAHWWAMREALGGRQTLSMATLDRVLHLSEQQQMVRDWSARAGVRRVIVADFSKNLFATVLACRTAELKVLAIVDNAPAFAGHSYRGIPIAPDDALTHHHADGIVISNINPAQVDRRLSVLRDRFDVPMLRLWKPQLMPSRDAATEPLVRLDALRLSRQAAG
jgi:GT2 family glycosyltransferase